MSTNNEFHKWRFLIALAHVDKRLMRAEQEFLERKIAEQASPGLHPRLLQEMRDDVLNPQPPDFFYYRISTPADKVDLLKLAHGLFWVDDDMDEQERIYLDGILHELTQDAEALALLKTVLPSWPEHDVGEKCLKRYVMERV